jgi:hypothetical protein
LTYAKYVGISLEEIPNILSRIYLAAFVNLPIPEYIAEYPSNISGVAPSGNA